jgi:hypothetical protein
MQAFSSLAPSTRKRKMLLCLGIEKIVFKGIMYFDYVLAQEAFTRYNEI